MDLRTSRSLLLPSDMAIDLNRVNPLTEAAIGAAIKVHKALGPGLLESVDLACLVFELRRSGASERGERATRPERADEAARERACRGVRGAKPLE